MTESISESESESEPEIRPDKKTNEGKKAAVFMAVAAAALYALSSPVSKLLLGHVGTTMMAALLYLGAGTGLLIVRLFQKQAGKKINEKKLSKSDLPYTVGMVVLDIAAPISLMAGLKMTTAANASLLNNFEIVATSLIALLIFKEKSQKGCGLPFLW